MGWYLHNNGGWNKQNGQVEQEPRIDSFDLHSVAVWGDIWCGRKLLEVEREEDLCRVYLPWGGEAEIELSHKVNGYGGGQVFFRCPECGNRARYLYLQGAAFFCRKCAGLNYRSQQRTRGSLDAYYQGMEYAEKHLGVSRSEWPDAFSFPGFIPPWPAGMHESTYLRRLARLARYEDKYAAQLMADVARIVGRFR